MRLKIAVSAVRFCPWPPTFKSGATHGQPPALDRRSGARQRSSAVEQPIRNRQVVSSNLTVGSKRCSKTAENDRTGGGSVVLLVWSFSLLHCGPGNPRSGSPSFR